LLGDTSAVVAGFKVVVFGNFVLKLVVVIDSGVVVVVVVVVFGTKHITRQL